MRNSRLAKPVLNTLVPHTSCGGRGFVGYGYKANSNRAALHNRFSRYGNGNGVIREI